MRILFSAWPGYGHLLPMLPLARAARDAGHDVVVATGGDLVPQVELRGFDAWSVGLTQAEIYSRFPDVGLLPPEQRFAAEVTAAFVRPADIRVADLIPRVRSWQPDLIVAELLDLSGRAAAADSGARLVVHGVGLVRPDLGADVASVADFATRWRVDASEATFLDICPPSLLGTAAPTGPRSQPLRPSRGDDMADSGVTDLSALDALPYAETVHVTLGTVFHKGPGVLEAAVAGLARLPVNVVVATGPDVDPSHLGPQPPNVLVRRYVPHATLLSRCVAVVSHAGAGTLLAGFGFGLPQLHLPQGADQFDNAAASVASGAALSLDPGQVDPDAVTEAAHRLLDDPRFAAAARRIRDEILSMPSAEEVVAELTMATVKGSRLSAMIGIGEPDRSRI